MFRADPRLQMNAVPAQGEGDELDLMTKLRGAFSSVRVLGDNYSTLFVDLLFQRFAGKTDFLEQFDIPIFEDKNVMQVSHSKVMPVDGAYDRVKRQTYWLALHVWLMHAKQNEIQEGQGILISAMCALLTRRIFEYHWNWVRGLIQAADVPIMSVQDELEDLQTYTFGFCVALDEIFRDEAPRGTEAALAMEDHELPGGCHGIGPRVKYALYANVFSGGIDHDSKELYELTVYFLRQRIMMEKLNNNAFLARRWEWVDHPPAK